MKDLAPGTIVSCVALIRFRLACSLPVHRFPELIRAVIASNTIEHLEIDCPTPDHPDDAAWRMHLPALTSLKTIVFGLEVPESIPSILANALKLHFVGFARCPSVGIIEELLYTPHREDPASLATLQLMSTAVTWGHNVEFPVVEEHEVPSVMEALALAIRNGKAAGALKRVELLKTRSKSLPAESKVELPWEEPGWAALKASETEERIQIVEIEV